MGMVRGAWLPGLSSFDRQTITAISHSCWKSNIRIHVHCLNRTRVARLWWVGWGCYVCKVIIVGRNNFVDVTILTDASHKGRGVGANSYIYIYVCMYIICITWAHHIFVSSSSDSMFEPGVDTRRAILAQACNPKMFPPPRPGCIAAFQKHMYR